MVITGWGWIYAILVGLLFFIVFSAFYGTLVYIRPQRFISEITPLDIGADYEDITLVTSDGLKLAAWFVPAETSAPADRPAGETSKKAILLLHGYPADKGDILSSTIFLRENYNLLYLDFRYFGKSQGRYSTIGVKEAQDVLAGVDYLSAAGMEKIGIWGFSMGGAAALMALPGTDKIDAVVSESSYARLDLMAREAYRQVPGLNIAIVELMAAITKLFLNLDIKEQSPVRAVAESNKPILFIHSRQDKVIPFEQAQRLEEASSLNPHAEFWFREDLDHGYLGEYEYSQRIKEFFGRHL